MSKVLGQNLVFKGLAVQDLKLGAVVGKADNVVGSFLVTLSYQSMELFRKAFVVVLAFLANRQRNGRFFVLGC